MIVVRQVSIKHRAVILHQLRGGSLPGFDWANHMQGVRVRQVQCMVGLHLLPLVRQRKV